MVKRKKGFERGDIILVNLNPTIGKEINNNEKIGRPALVISPKDFNDFGMVFIAPITNGGNYSKSSGMAVTLMGTGIKTTGAVVVNQCKMIDAGTREAKYIETAPDEIVDEVIGRLYAILE